MPAVLPHKVVNTPVVGALRARTNPPRDPSKHQEPWLAVGWSLFQGVGTSFAIEFSRRFYNFHPNQLVS